MGNHKVGTWPNAKLLNMRELKDRDGKQQRYIKKKETKKKKRKKQQQQQLITRAKLIEPRTHHITWLQ